MTLTRFNAEMDGEALADAYDRGVQDTLDRLTSDEAVQLVADGLTPASWTSDERELFARRTLASLAAALSPERRETT